MSARKVGQLCCLKGTMKTTLNLAWLKRLLILIRSGINEGRHRAISGIGPTGTT